MQIEHWKVTKVYKSDILQTKPIPQKNWDFNGRRGRKPVIGMIATAFYQNRSLLRGKKFGV